MILYIFERQFMTLLNLKKEMIIQIISFFNTSEKIKISLFFLIDLIFQ